MRFPRSKPARSGAARSIAAVAAAVVALGVVGAGALGSSSCGARTGLDAPGGGGAGPLECVPGKAELERAIPALMFVVDASGSMDIELGASGETRWNAMRKAFAETLPPVDASMELGLMVYPTFSGAKNCNAGQAALSPGVNRVAEVLDELDGRKPSGATPTADAIDVAASTLLQHRAAAAARTLVLATDGGPNCNQELDTKTCECIGGDSCNDPALCLDDVRTTGVISKYAKKGIPTYVIGIAADDDTFSDVLNEMADAGGRARVGQDLRYYPVASAADFDAALTTIRDQVGACTYLTKSIPDASGTIVVMIDGAEIPFDPTGADGWFWANVENGEILFNGPPCTALSTGDHVVTAIVTCGPPPTTSAATTGASSTGP